MTSKYYGLTNPTVAIWPTNWDTINQHDLMNASQNKGTERAKLHLVMEKYMYTLELPFDADQDAVRKLGLEGLPNINYINAMKQAVGL